MTKALFGFLLFISFSNLNAQKATTQEIDSIFRVAQRIVSKYPDSSLVLSSEIKIQSAELKYEWGFLQQKLLRGLIYYQKNELDSAANTLLEVISEFEQSKDESFEAGKARNILGLIYQRMNSFDKAEENFVKSVEIFKSLQNDLYMMMSLNNVGTTYGMRGGYPEALEVFIQLKELALSGTLSEKESKARLVRALSNIGTIYSLMGNNDIALDYAKQSLEINLASKDSFLICNNYINLGEIFNDDKQLDSALFYYNRCLASTSVNSPRFIPLIMDARRKIASVYYQQGKIEDAIFEVESSMKMRSGAENYGLVDSYDLLARYYQKLGQFDRAFRFSRLALSMAEENRSKRSARRAAERLVDLFVETKRYDSAFYYKSLYHTYSDSIFNESNERKFNNLRIELETSDKQNEIEILKKQGEIDETRRANLVMIIISISCLFFALFSLLIYRHRNKQKKHRIKEMELQQEIEKKHIELQQQTLHMINLNNNISEVEERLIEVKKKETVSMQDVQKVLSNITISKSMDKEWQQFEAYFSNIHPEFNGQLVKQHNNLTQQERRLTALIRMDLSNREIASLLNIEQRSVIMNRYRLKQKLGLKEQEDLDLYIQRF